MRVAFAGTPAFGRAVLQALIDGGHEVALVITQPDRPAGRGLAAQPPPVKELARERGLPIWQPERPSPDEWVRALEACRAEALVVAAYALKIPAAVLDLPRFGCLNVHASLLPRWRGAAPIAWAILAGDRVTGVTVLRMDEGWDTGPLLLQETETIRPDDNQASLHDRLAQKGGRLLLVALNRLASGTLAPVQQDSRHATLAPRLAREQGLIDWSKSARQLERQVRAFTPWPGAFTHLGQRMVKVLAAQTADGPAAAGPGEVVGVDPDRQALGIACGQGTLFLVRVQVEGGRPMSGQDLANGYRLRPGSRLGDGAP